MPRERMLALGVAARVALAALDCRITEIVPIDSHAILIGTVEDVLFGPKRPPLINFEGGFTTVIDTIPEKTT